MRVLGAVLVGLVLCLVLSGCGGSKVTKENADKITTGMSEQEVTNLLGPPNESKEIESGGVAVDMMGVSVSVPAAKVKRSLWRDGNRVIEVDFFDGKVHSKVTRGF
jgi:hypothetical protein